MNKPTNQSGFTAVELIITLFVAAGFLVASYQLYSLIIKDGGATRAESRASNVAYDYLRQYAASSTTVPCTPSTPLTDSDLTIDGLSSTSISIIVSCLPDSISSLSKVEAVIKFNNPTQTIKYATYVSSSGTSGAADNTNGLVAWWKLNGDANNSVGAPNGVISGAISTSNQAGQSDTAYSFNGSSTINTASTFNMNATDASISCWIFNPVSSNRGLFVNVGTSGGYGIGIGGTSTNDNGSNLIILLTSVRWAPTTTTIGVGWHHVVLTVNSAGIPTAYLNGTSAGSYPGTGPSAPNGSLTTIGARTNSPAHLFTGTVDDVRLYNRTLSPTEIVALYAAGAK
jgi:Tfp pilus assembly protein PilE